MDRINWLNSGLMIAAAAAATAAPFHVFLFSYAILGPLHYLTEISWLHDRQYFAPRVSLRRLWLVIVVLAAIAVTYGFVSNDLLGRKVAPTLEIGLVYLALLAAAAALFIRHAANGIALCAAGAVIIAIAAGHPLYGLVAYLIVTIVHVLLFTGCFVLYGSLKSGSRSGLISLGVFIACAIVPFVVHLPAMTPSSSIRSVYAGFEQLNIVLLRLFGHRGEDVYGSTALAVMRLIAFAYTYHYLNWFSKTSVIKWHEISRKRAIGIVGAWLGGIAIYAWDYRAGFAVFYVLSVVHVMLEFPLDHQTIVGLIRMIPGRSVARPSAHPVPHQHRQLS